MHLSLTELVAKLKSLRKESKLVQREVTKLTEVCQKDISRIESGKTIEPKISTLAKLANLYGYEIKFVLVRKDGK